MRRKIIAATMATAKLLSMAAPTAYAEDIVVGATSVEGAEAAESIEAPAYTYNAAVIEINEANFPDETFRQYVSDNFDASEPKDGKLSPAEIAAVIEINVGSTNHWDSDKQEYVPDGKIASLKGVEYFTALKQLYCYDNQLTTLDVSNCTALTTLSCYNNQLTTLDVSNCAALTYLSCSTNRLTTLDVGNNTALTYLNCSDNQLTTLDVSKNTALTYFDCSTNQPTTLDVSKNTALAHLFCNNNQLTTLDVSKNNALADLGCDDNQLTSLDVSKNTALTWISCNNNQLTSFNVSNNTVLTTLNCGGNQLTTLDVSDCTALAELFCFDNHLTTLDVSNNTALTVLCCENNSMPILNLENNKMLIKDSTTYSPQTIKCSEKVDISSLVGADNFDRVSDIKTSDNGVAYSCDVKGAYDDGSAMPKMQVIVEMAETSQPTPEPTTPANPDDNTGTGDSNDNTNNGTDATPETPNTEATTGFVDRLYSVCLGRPADAAGQADWVKQLTSYQISGTKAAYGFIFSEEFTNMNYSNADFVEHLYEAFMGRASDEGGKADWVGKLDAGTTREEVFNGFANSVEFDNICKSYGIVSKDIETFVTRLYSVCLDRQPDDAGLADWANQLRSQTISGKAAASGFVFSEEFTNKNYSNADYVEHLYAAFMGRASDEGGKADWVSKLDAGTTREEVFNGFADSAEFDNICSSYGIVRG